MLRVAAASLLLFVQTFGFLHVVAASHVAGGDAVLDVRADERHAGEHVCAAPADAQTETCAVFALWRQLAPGVTAPVLHATALVVDDRPHDERSAHPTLTALMVAPKSSPPAGAVVRRRVS